LPDPCAQMQPDLLSSSSPIPPCMYYHRESSATRRFRKLRPTMYFPPFLSLLWESFLFVSQCCARPSGRIFRKSYHTTYSFRRTNHVRRKHIRCRVIKFPREGLRVRPAKGRCSIGVELYFTLRNHVCKYKHTYCSLVFYAMCFPSLVHGDFSRSIAI